jgi:similar to stage IV sporulation protein
MISLKLTRWLLGYARFSVRGGSPERFLNQCARNGINLWDIRGGGNCGACVVAGSYRLLRSCARKAGCRLKVEERHGFPFATKGIRKRRGLLVGAALGAAVIGLLSMNVWSIEVSGNTTIPTQTIKNELAAMGVVCGTPKRYVDPQMLQQRLMLKFPQIAWLSVNTIGCSAEIRLQERTEKPLIQEKEYTVCNIKAAATGQIVSLEVYTGTAQVKEGDAVVEGQLLISGVVENDLGVPSLRHAAGKVIAETTRTMTEEVALKRTEIKPTGRVVTQRSFNLFGIRIPLTLAGKPNGNYEAEGLLTEVRLMNSVLPMSLYEQKWVEHDSYSYTLNRDQAIQLAEEQIKQRLQSELKDVQVVSQSATDQIKDSKLIYTVNLKCRENIAQESEILIK